MNPMLGFRGCRLGILYPELTKMHARAIFEAAISMSNQGVKVLPEIMVPLTGTPQEFEHQVSLIRTVAQQAFTEMGTSISYKVGTMIEVPRAALVADEIAVQAEFFSFGTNDLTQMTFEYSRDDVRKFLPIYLSKGILQNDPFEVLDQKGVGQLIKIAAERGRRARPDLKSLFELNILVDRDQLEESSRRCLKLKQAHCNQVRFVHGITSSCRSFVKVLDTCQRRGISVKHSFLGDLIKLAANQISGCGNT
ncbi:pyruvate, phosphate dikinase, chloroplastic-like isoform X3 [Musa acuminata AAA Group]|uniref:pyruvate, phosphate dikinase, chloroplastic-like isoform X3 n=1 Tax=Musa acuminata AAA Group TaxID=214697 RepID=UPI0031D67CD9